MSEFIELDYDMFAKELVLFDKLKKSNIGKHCFIHTIPEFRKYIKEKYHYSRKEIDMLFNTALTKDTKFDRLRVHGRPCMTKLELKQALKTNDTGIMFTANKVFMLWSLD